jgi:hypothetical protein
MRAQERNRPPRAEDRLARRLIEQHVRLPDRQAARLDREIAAPIERDDDWRGRAGLLRSVPGVGPGTAAVLVAELPELGAAGAKQSRPWPGWPRTPTTPARPAAAAGVAGGRAGVRAGAVHGGRHGPPVQPGRPGVRRPARGRRQAVQGRDHRLHAEAAGDAERAREVRADHGRTDAHKALDDNTGRFAGAQDDNGGRSLRE